MKKLSIAILLLLLASPCLSEEVQVQYPGKTVMTLEDPWTQYARMSTAIVGGGMTAAAGCTIDTDGEIFATANNGTAKLGSTWVCTKVTFAGGTSTVTGYKVDLCYGGAGTSATLQLYTHNSGSDIPESAITGTSATMTTASGCDTFQNVTVNLATPVSSIASPCWICVHQTDGATFVYGVKYNSESGKRATYGDLITDNPTNNMSLAIDVWGCTP
jgi:hypothetical protein